MSVCLHACLSACLPACLPVCLSACLSVYQPVCLSVCLSLCLSVCMHGCLSVCLSVCLPIYLAPWPSACLFVCLPTYLRICLTVCCYVLNAPRLLNVFTVLFMPPVLFVAPRRVKASCCFLHDPRWVNLLTFSSCHQLCLLLCSSCTQMGKGVRCFLHAPSSVSDCVFMPPDG